MALHGLACCTALLPGPAPHDAPSRPPARLDYRVECVLDGVPDRLEVELRVSGLDPANRDLAFELPLWGEWLTLDEYYVTRVRGSPPVEHDLLNRFYWRPQLPEKWDGRLAFHYELPIVAFGCAAQQRFGLLPWRTATYVHGYSVNTLMRLLVGDARQDGDRHLELVAPKGWSVVTGWGGLAEARQSVVLAPTADNTLVVFGEPVATKTSDGEGGHVEVVQFGRHEDRTGIVMELAQRVRAAYAKNMDAPPPGSEHIVVTEPGLGGTRIEGAITIGHPSIEENGRPDVGTDHFIAHELFHSWLPGVLAPGPGLDDRGLEWFYEGFTDYFSLWSLAAIGRITPQQFADHVRFLETFARASPALGKVSFADPSVNWRDGDAEPIAYKGGLMLALHFDVELRDHGEPGLPMLFRDLMRENGGRYGLAAIKKWCEANGLEEAWKQYAAAPKLPSVEDDLVRLGYRETREGDSRIIRAAGAELDSFFRFDPPAK